MEMIPEHFTEAKSLRGQILYVLSVMKKGSAGEIAAAIVELQGVASEDGVAELTINVERELENMCEEGTASELKEHRQKKRYQLVGFEND
jgi:phage tail sheath gpL-like